MSDPAQPSSSQATVIRSQNDQSQTQLVHQSAATSQQQIATSQAAPPVPHQQASQTPSVPAAGSVQKETGPVAAVSEFVKPSEIEPQLHPEVQEAGVEIQHEQPSLPADAQKLGIKVMHEATPVATEPTNTVQLPMTANEAQQIEKSAKISDSIKWLATMILRQIKINNRK